MILKLRRDLEIFRELWKVLENFKDFYKIREWNRVLENLRKCKTTLGNCTEFL